VKLETKTEGNYATLYSPFNEMTEISVELDRYKKKLKVANQKIEILQRMIEDQTRELFYKNNELEKIVEERTQELYLKNSALEHRNTELLEISYVVSHDLQEPLRTIASFVDLFQQQFKGSIDGNADIYIKYITEATARMQRLIKDLLDYSRIGKEKSHHEIDCNKLISHLMIDMSSSINNNQVKFEIDLLPTIYASETDLRLLFQNLISNAIKFRKKNQTPVIRISARKIDDGYQFEVSDNGIGIDPRYKEKIFILFQRLHNKSDYEGTGIGLAHCRKIVEAHGGKIWVNSMPGEGSLFCFTLKSIQ